MNVCRFLDVSAGACGCSPINAIGPTVGNVLVNFLPPMVVTDFWGVHSCCGDDCEHPEFCITGSPRVLIGGRSLVTSISNLSAGDMTISGSPTVYAGF